MPRSRVPPGPMIYEILSGGAALRELKSGNRSVFDRVDIEDPLKPDYPVNTVDPSPVAATVIELFREYKVRIAEDNFSALTGRVRPGTIFGRARQKAGMTYPSFTTWFYKARKLGLVQPVEELPLDRAGKPPGRLGNPGGLLTIRRNRTGSFIGVRARRVLYELTPEGRNFANWTNVGGSYDDLVGQAASERKPEDIPMPLENEFTSTIGGRLETEREVPIRISEMSSSRARIQAPQAQTTTGAGGEAPVIKQPIPAGLRDEEQGASVSTPASETPEVPESTPEIPEFDLGEKPEKRTVGLLIGHLQRLVDIGVGFEDVQAEIEDIADQADDWMNQIAEQQSEEEEKDAPNSLRVKELDERFEALSNAIAELRDFDPKGAIITLREGFGLL